MSGVAGPWVTFNLMESSVLESDPYITVLKDQITAVQAAFNNGAIIHLPSGVVRVTESVDTVLERIV